MADKMQSRIALNMLGVEVTIDPDDPAMPEDVREYYREYMRQAEAELTPGVYEMSPRQMPDYVVQYCIGILRRIEERYEELNDTVRAGNVDRAYLTEYIALKAALIAQEKGRRLDSRQKDRLYGAARGLAEEFRLLLRADSDWQGLGALQAVRLYAGVIIARIGLIAGRMMQEVQDDAEQG